MKEVVIRHFGPIGEGFDGNMPVYPITLFCGHQGSGKSTVAKVISTFSWLEKALVRGDIVSNKKTNTPNFLKHQFEFHRINNYFNKGSELYYKGDRYDFRYANEEFSILEKTSDAEFLMPKIMYVPAERNFLTVVEHPEILKEIPKSLFALFIEYDNARKSLNKEFGLPIDGYSFQHDKLNNVSWLAGKDFKVRLSEAASGFQSLIPLVLVSYYLLQVIKQGSSSINAKQVDNINKRIAQILADDTISEATRKILISQQSSLLKYSRFVNVVEEPEQNLFPSSQKDILYDLFSAYNNTKGNQLIITTHSPYLIDYTTLAIKAKSLSENKKIDEDRIQKIVPKKAWIEGGDVCVYQIHNGNILPLKKYDDMPSDDNFLNQELGETNELFAQLLEMEG